MPHPNADKLQEIQAKAAAVRKQLAALDALSGRGGERDRDAARKRAQRAVTKEVFVPDCADPARRAALEADDVAWLRHYFGPDSGTLDPFTYAFTAQQLEMIAAIASAISFGGDTAIAASRGEGKTTIFERMLLKYTLQGTLHFSVLCAATGDLAENSLDTIRTAIEENVNLAADYPEVCAPVVALEHTPSRAHYQLVTGRRHAALAGGGDAGEPYQMHPSRFTWCGREIVLPNVPGSPAARAIIATRGLDSAVRGLKRKGRRVELVGIDDPDTEDTARSESQAAKLELRIDRALGGLGSQTRPVARVMLTTLQSRIAVSYRFTDPAQKPTWKGKRFRFLVTPPTPEGQELWQEYVERRRGELVAFAQNAAGTSTDEHARGAHAFYLANREVMDAGAVVGNPNRYDGAFLPDGSQLEVSALEHYYNEVLSKGPDAVRCELDNDPPEEAGPVESGITAYRIQRQVSGLERGVLPAGCVKVTRGIDCGKRALHWVIRGWREDGTGFTIDYGVHEVLGTHYDSDEGLDAALRRALLAYLEDSKARYPFGIDRTLVDAGWRTPAVYAACREAGLGVQPVMGFGKSSGCVSLNFSEQQRRTRDRVPGDGYFLSRKGKLWLVCADADRWKAWEHDRWLTGPDRPGRMHLFGMPGTVDRPSRDEKDHHAYARHLTNEVEVEEPHAGTMRRRWKAKSANTHWFDASYYSDVAAAMEGVRVLGVSGELPAAAVRPSERPTARDLMNKTRPEAGGRRPEAQ